MTEDQWPETDKFGRTDSLRPIGEIIVRIVERMKPEKDEKTGVSNER